MPRAPGFGSSLLLAALTLVACGGGDDDATGTTTSVTSTSTTTGGTTTTTEGPAKPAILLQPDGLGVAHFGEQKPSVVAAIALGLGPPDGTGKGCELAGTDVTTASWKELTVQFSDGAFDSYSVRPGPSGDAVLDLATEKGIRIGSTVAQLHGAYGDHVTIPGLPPDFGEPSSFSISFDGSERSILGLLTGTNELAKVKTFFTQLCE